MNRSADFQIGACSQCNELRRADLEIGAPLAAFMASMRDCEIVAAFPEPAQGAPAPLPASLYA